tara:strand:+ start:121 stop:1290 length:1170 start_codon:yes stop_codon:yes gene_type:complete
MTIYFFYSEPFDKLKIKEFDLEFVESIGFDIKIINLLFLSNIKYSSDEKKRFLFQKSKNEVFCQSFDEILSILNTINKNDIVFYNVAFIDYKRFVHVIKFFNKNKIRYGIIANMLSPVLYYKSIFRRIIFFIEKRSLLFSTIIRGVVRKIKKPFFNPDFIITAGKTPYLYNKLTYGSKPKYFNIPSLDYQKSLEPDQHILDYVQNKKYNLFIEQGDPFHPDQMHIKQDKICAKEYYRKIEIFLLELEKNTGLETIIALPPKTNLFFPELLDFFSNRLCFVNKTAELIKYSEMVVMQKSTAISFALLFKKPILFFSLLKSGDEYEIIKKLANSFCQHVYSLEENFSNFSFNKTYNSKKYNQHITNFILYKNAFPLSKNKSFIKYLKNQIS